MLGGDVVHCGGDGGVRGDVELEGFDGEVLGLEGGGCGVDGGFVAACHDDVVAVVAGEFLGGLVADALVGAWD